MHSEFQVHILNEDGAAKAKRIALLFDDLLTSLETYCKPGRELALVKTKLEEASFFAKKSIANNPDNQKVTS